MNTFGYGGAHIAQFIGMAVWGLVMLVLLVVGLGLAFLLARFLLVATKAAQHYLDKNGVVTTRAPKTAPAGLYSPGRPAAEPASSVVPPTATTVVAPETVVPPKAAAPRKPATTTSTATTKVNPVVPPAATSTKPVTQPRTPKTPPPAV